METTQANINPYTLREIINLGQNVLFSPKKKQETMVNQFMVEKRA